MRGGGVKMEEKAQCPLCNRYWPIQEIEEHAAGCTGENNEPLEEIADLALDEMVLECFICGSRDSSEFHAMEECCHMACKKCLREYIMKHVREKRPSRSVCMVKDCKKALVIQDFRDLLLETELEEWEASTMAEYMLEHGEKYVKCPKCETVLEKIQVAKTDLDVSLAKEKHPPSPVPLTKDTFQHYNNNRFKCRECDTEFCSECSAMPYHMGYTCATFQTFKASAHCRFCDAQLKKENTAPAMQYSPALRDVCSQRDCLERRDASCAATLKCGHACGGILQDAIFTHLPCWQCKEEKASEISHAHAGNSGSLNSGNSNSGNSGNSGNSSSSAMSNASKPAVASHHHNSQLKDDYCNICWSESLGAAPCVQLACSHIFHHHCLLKNLAAKWQGVTITFGFLECPLCKHQVSHPALASHLKPYLDLQAEVHKKALDRFNHMNLKDAKELTEVTSPYYQQPLKYALARFCYYPCFKCKKPYFGGLKECSAEQRVAGKDDKLEELICGSCSAQGSGASSSCAKHGTDYIEYKCKFCCNVAAWYCWGSTHFCEECHKKAAEIAKLPKDKLPKCTCSSKHPPNGEEHCLGCSLCRFNDSF